MQSDSRHADDSTRADLDNIVAFAPVERRLSRLIDRAHEQLEMTADPAVIRAWRGVLNDLEAIAERAS